MFLDHLSNTTNFLPTTSTIVNGVTVNGAAVIPNQYAFSILNAGFAQSIYPTPVLTAAQAGIPESLRYSAKTDFAPRVGFAWLWPFNGDKTVIRGGYGRFIEALLGSALPPHGAFRPAMLRALTTQSDQMDCQHIRSRIHIRRTLLYQAAKASIRLSMLIIRTPLSRSGI